MAQVKQPTSTVQKCLVSKCSKILERKAKEMLQSNSSEMLNQHRPGCPEPENAQKTYVYYICTLFNQDNTRPDELCVTHDHDPSAIHGRSAPMENQ